MPFGSGTLILYHLSIVKFNKEIYLILREEPRVELPKIKSESDEQKEENLIENLNKIASYDEDGSGKNVLLRGIMFPFNYARNSIIPETQMELDLDWLHRESMILFMFQGEICLMDLESREIYRFRTLIR